jgi:hypothetical protein
MDNSRPNQQFLPTYQSPQQQIMPMQQTRQQMPMGQSQMPMPMGPSQMSMPMPMQRSQARPQFQSQSQPVLRPQIPLKEMKEMKEMKENITAEVSPPPTDNTIGVNQLVLNILGIVAFSAVFILPQQLQVFWVVIIGLSVLMHIGMSIYKEMIMQTKEENGEKSTEYAWILLCSLLSVYSSVMLGILMFMAWSLYGLAHAKSDLVKVNKH